MKDVIVLLLMVNVAMFCALLVMMVVNAAQAKRWREFAERKDEAAREIME